MNAETQAGMARSGGVTPDPYANGGARGGATWIDSATLNAVRPAVRDTLAQSEAFSLLPEKERRDLAQAMVKVAAYLANPEGLGAAAAVGPGSPIQEAQATAAPARAQADAVEETRKRLSKDPGFAGEDFQAGAVRQGVQAFGQLVQTVDFPKFVGGLIQNVFQAIVDASIQQMQAYGELLANVAKTVDQFAQDNVTPNNAVDWLAGKFPDALSVETESMSGSFAEGDQEPPQQARLAVTAEDPEAALQRISQELKLAKAITDLSDPEEHTRLVQAARLEMARGRQQLLASMVMLGINRIVVTDGLIHAKVVFDLRASDQARRVARASMMDQNKVASQTNVSASYGSWFSPVSASMDSHVQTEHVATVQSAVENTSESKAEVKAKLSGEVRVNFKSDYFPMEKLASPQMIAAIQGNAKPPEPAASAAAAGGAPPAAGATTPATPRPNG